MSTLRTVVAVAWIVFWIYWLITAVAAKRGTGGIQRTRVGALIVLLVLIPFIVDSDSLEVHALALAIVGTAITISGLAFAVWARIHAINLTALLVAVVLTVYFWYSATVEERNLHAVFPKAYPAYRTHTKMLIPFVL